MTEHYLKCWPEIFEAVSKGEKPWDLRKNDRGFAVGDILVLEECIDGEYTGKVLRKEVVYILHGGQFGLDAQHVIMTIY